MRRCDNCDGRVTEQFVRVFGTDDGDLLACHNCSAQSAVAQTISRRGRGRDPDLSF